MKQYLVINIYIYGVEVHDDHNERVKLHNAANCLPESVC